MAPALTTNGLSAKYFLQDHLGSMTALTDSAGGVTESRNYDSFGLPGLKMATRYQYTGREFDNQTGLYYYRARWYDPTLGRFISEDPIGFGGGDINHYGYVWNSPLKFSDPTGLDGWGNDTADWLDERIEFARRWYQGDVQNWVLNGSVNTGADLAFGFSDLLRVGSGTGKALYCEDNAYGKAAFIAMDIGRASGIFATLAAPGARFANSPKGVALNDKLVGMTGREIRFGNDLRVAPFGNRTGHPTGERPHYHRRRFDANGDVQRGQGLKRHRPWDTRSTDNSFWDRF